MHQSTYLGVEFELASADRSKSNSDAGSVSLKCVREVIRHDVVGVKSAIDALTNDVDSVGRSRVVRIEALFGGLSGRITTARDHVQEVELLAVETLGLCLQFERVLGVDGEIDLIVQRHEVNGRLNAVRVEHGTCLPSQFTNETALPSTLKVVN